VILGLYISAAGMKAQQLQQTVIANNLANARTEGFKRDLVLMQSRLNAGEEDPRMYPYRVPELAKQGGGVQAMGNGVDLTQANFEDSANQTDLALDGPGFFTVAGENGQKLLTRSGRFVLAQDGTLVTAVGRHAVLDAAGQPIVLNTKLPVEVGTDGQISQGASAAPVKLGLADVTDPRQVVKLGGNVMTVANPEALTEAPPDTRVLQNRLEASGVDPMSEIVNMMEGQRAFEANARMISYQDSTLSQLNQVGRVA
jgi:flagellar basal-body rod protein FlgF